MFHWQIKTGRASVILNEETGVKINTTDKNTKGIPDISEFGGFKVYLEGDFPAEFKKLQKSNFSYKY